MAALQEEEEESAVGPPHSYHVKAQDYDEEMPMITVVTKNRRVPNILIDGGSGVNIMTNALRKKLGLTNIEAAPFTIKMADQRKVVPVGLIRNLKMDVGGVKKMMTFTVIDLPPMDNDYEMMLGRTWLKQDQAKHDWGTSKITLQDGKEEVGVNVQRNPAVPASKRALAWEDYDWEAGLLDEEEATVYKAFPELQPIAKVDLSGLKELYEAGCHVVNPIEESKEQVNTLEREEKNKMAKGTARKSQDVANNPRRYLRKKKRTWKRNQYTPLNSTK